MTKTFLTDLAERVGFTFIETFLGAVVLSGAFDISTLHAAAIAGLASCVAVIKGAVASRVGPAGTAGMVTVDPTPPPPGPQV